MWFQLKGDERITQRCATEGCGGQPTWRLEAGGVGSPYCSGCKNSLDRLDRLEHMGFADAAAFARNPQAD